MSRIIVLLGVASPRSWPAAAAAGDSSAGGKVTLRYGLWDSNQTPVYQKCADAFQKQNPNIKIVIETRRTGTTTGAGCRAASSPTRRRTCSPTTWPSTRSSRPAR